MVDKQTFTVSAVPIPEKGAFRFNVSHWGTLFLGRSIAAQMHPTGRYELPRASLKTMW
jgi:hypothetical protein